MPELPEVETVRRTLMSRVLGRRVTAVAIDRPDVIHTSPGRRSALPLDHCNNARRAKALRGQLLEGGRIASLQRHGKQLAVVGDTGPCFVVHLGMSGTLRWVAADRLSEDPPAKHTHVTWALDDGSALRFRDPRRFGGLWLYASLEDLQTKHWSQMGDDSLVIKPRELHARCLKTRRHVKAVLLDQQVIAGLGNIYVDEVLFTCRLAPQLSAEKLSLAECQALVRAIRKILNRSIQAGGSTLRDYVDSEGRSGGFQTAHQVYGRAGEPCVRCGAPIQSEQIGGRTTCWCNSCQPCR